jgi:hypothetical protein
LKDWYDVIHCAANSAARAVNGVCALFRKFTLSIPHFSLLEKLLKKWPLLSLWEVAKTCTVSLKPQIQ